MVVGPCFLKGNLTGTSLGPAYPSTVHVGKSYVSSVIILAIVYCRYSVSKKDRFCLFSSFKASSF